MHTASPAHVPSDGDQRGDSKVLPRERILIVEDDEGVRALLTRRLSGEYDVEAAEGGKAAIEAVRARRPDLILLDMKMPGLDGADVLRTLRRDPSARAIPVIVLSGRGDEASRLAGLEAGATDYVVKSAGHAELLARIRRLLEMEWFRKQALARERELREAAERELRDRIAAEGALRASERQVREVLNALPAAVYTCDADGRITMFNRAAVDLWGREPVIGVERWCGSAKMLDLDGREIALEDCPMAVTLKTGRPVRGREFVIERPNGTRRRVLPHPQPILGEGGRLTGAVNMLVDLTDIRRTEQALVESEERLRLATQTGKVGLWDWDIVANRVTWTESLYALHGVRPEEFGGTVEAFRDLVHPEDRALVEAALRRTLEEGAKYELEFRVLTPAGQTVWVFTNARVFRGGGRPVRMVGSTTDITAQKQVEAELAATKDDLVQEVAVLTRLRDLATHLAAADDLEPALGLVLKTLVELHAADSGVLSLHDENAGVLRVAARTGYPPGAVGNFEEIPITMPCPCTAAFKSARPVIVEDAETCAEYGEEFRRFARSARLRGIFSTPIISGGGAVLGVMTVQFRVPRRPSRSEMQAADMCAYKAAVVVQAMRARRALRESERRFRELADDAPVLIWLSGEHGCEFVNREYLRFVGTDLEGVRGSDWREFLHPDDAEHYTNTYRRASARREAFTAEARFRRADGENRWLTVTGVPRRGRGGEVPGYVGCCVDITDQVRARHALQEHQAWLEEAVRTRTEKLHESYERLRIAERMALLGTLSAGLGHDMGNLLVPLRVRLATLSRGGLPPELQEDVDAIRASADYLQRLASGLRLLALDPAHAPSNETTDLASWWAEAAPMLRNALPRGVALASRLEGVACRVAMSRAALTQVVFNLVQNAGDSMRARGAGTVWVEAESDEPRVRVRVRDDGPGMTPEVRARCMEPFFTTKPRGMSTGLGLALVYGLVREARGTVDLESEPGVGTAFTLSLPRADGDERGDEGVEKGVAVVEISDDRMRALVTAELRALAVRVRGNGESSSTADVVVVENESRIPSNGNSAGKVVLLGDLKNGREGVIATGARPGIRVIRDALRRAVRGE